MKKVYLIFLIVIIFILGLNLFKKHQLSAKYSETIGAKFVENLNLQSENENDKERVKDLPYDLSFYSENNKIEFNKKVLYKDNRSYMPLSEFLRYFGQSEEVDSDNIRISNLVDIDVKEKTYTENEVTTKLRGALFKENNEYYVSFFDLCEMLNLNTYWDYNNKSIYISKKEIKNFKNKDNKHKKNKKNKKAFIRFEDFTAGDLYITKSALEKVRAVADYMDEEDASFSVAWIPKYVNNTNHIYNDVSQDESMINSNFVFTLDYLLNRGGNIGLHGYTHQYGDSNSVSGSEFGDKGYNKESEIRSRVESALEIANKLNIPISYWETPHYRTNVEQQKIFEEYFKIIYEPSIKVYNKKIITSKTNGVTKYIPTPLSYVDDDKASTMIDRIKNKKDNEELSFFYHLTIELKDIDIYLDKNGRGIYNYNEDSILKQLVKYINDSEYMFEDINNL
jgi:Uncharacterized protein conserved in bacteria (DUF2334)